MSLRGTTGRNSAAGTQGEALSLPDLPYNTRAEGDKGRAAFQLPVLSTDDLPGGIELEFRNWA